MALIYKVTNKINGKVYIGLTTRTLEIRRREHFYNAKSEPDSRNKFYRALRKYDAESFEWSIIEDDLSDDEVKLREIYWVKYYNSYKKGYNSTKGGDTCYIEPFIHSLYNEDQGVITGTSSELAKILKVKSGTISTFFCNCKINAKGLDVLMKKWVRLKDKERFRELTGYRAYIHKDGRIFKGVLSDFIRMTNANPGSMTQMIAGKRKTVNKWRIYDDN